MADQNDVLGFLERFNRVLPMAELQNNLQRLTVLDNQMYVPSVRIKLNQIPGYPLLLERPVYEQLSQEALKRTLYYCKDRRPINGFDYDRHAESLTLLGKIMGASDERLERLRVSFRPRFNMGRYYADISNDENVRMGTRVGSSIRLCRSLRSGVLRYSGYVDLDMVKSHPTIMCIIGNMSNIATPGLLRYVQTPDVVMQEMSDFWSVPGQRAIRLRDCKGLISRTIYGGGLAGWLDELRQGAPADLDGILPDLLPTPVRNDDGVLMPEIYRLIRDECNKLIDEVVAANPEIGQRVCPLLTDGPRKRRIISYFCQTIEHHLTYSAFKYCCDGGHIPTRTDGSRHFIWGYDGFSWIPRADVDIGAVLQGLNAHLVDTFGPLFESIRFIDKVIPLDECVPAVLDDNHDLWASNDFRMWDPFDLPEEAVAAQVPPVSRAQMVATDLSYDQLKNWFEADHFKIENMGVYAREIKDKNGDLKHLTFITHQELATRYCQYAYWGLDKKGNACKLPFITNWIKDNKLRMYEECSQYPPPLLCPPTHYNAYTYAPFHNMRLPRARRHPRALQIFRDFLTEMCGGPTNVDTLAYIEKWIAHHIQHADRKIGVMPIFQGSEGCGKTVLTSVLIKMFGGLERCFDTDQKHFSGKNNMLIFMKPFGAIQEMTPVIGGGDNDVTSAMKRVVTDTSLIYEDKFLKAFCASSWHNVMGTTNFSNVFSSDRRAFYAKCTTKYKYDEVKMTEVIDLMTSDNALATIYKYYQEIDLWAMFGPEPIQKYPMTALNSDARICRKPIIMFGYFLCDHYDSLNIVEANITGADLLNQYKAWHQAYNQIEAPATLTPMELTNMFVSRISWPENCISAILARTAPGASGNLRKYNFTHIRAALENL